MRHYKDKYVSVVDNSPYVKEDGYFDKRNYSSTMDFVCTN